jgi:hypothetical protein
VRAEEGNTSEEAAPEPEEPADMSEAGAQGPAEVRKVGDTTQLQLAVGMGYKWAAEEPEGRQEEEG